MQCTGYQTGKLHQNLAVLISRTGHGKFKRMKKCIGWIWTSRVCLCPTVFSDQFTRSTSWFIYLVCCWQERDYARCVGIHEMGGWGGKQCTSDVTVHRHVGFTGSDRADPFKIHFMCLLVFSIRCVKTIPNYGWNQWKSARSNVFWL